MLLHILMNLEDIDVDYMTADQKMKNQMENMTIQAIHHNLKENTSKELFALTLRAHEMENVKDLRAKALKKKMNGVMIRHRTTCCMIQKNMNTEYQQHTDERGVIFTHITWLFKETTWGYRFTPWLTAVSRWKDSSRGDRPTISPRSTLHTNGWTRSR